MKRKFSILALLVAIATTAMAQTFVQPETGKYYKLKGDNKDYPWLTNKLKSNSIIVSGNESDAAIFLKTENDGLKDVVTGKYLGMNGSTVSLVGNEATINIGQYNDNNATGNGIKYSVKVVNGSYMYNNNTDGITHESSEWLNIERYWGFIEQDAAEVLTTLKASAVAHVGEHTAYLGTGIGYYSYVVGGAKTADPEAVKAAINAAATIEAVSAIVGTYAVNLPEFGKAYTMTLVANDANKTQYKIIATDGKLEAKTEGENSVFYCLQSNSNDYPYIFVSEDGYVLGCKKLVSEYCRTDNRHNFKVGTMVNPTSGGKITSNAADRLGMVYITTAARDADTGGGGVGCLIFKYTANSTTAWDNSSAPYHDATYTSAIVMTEQDINTLTDAQVAKADEILGRTALKEQVERLRGQLKNQVGYYYCTINGVKMYDADAILAAINAASSAATVAEIAAAVNAKTPVMPEYGKAYKMAFKTKAGALHHIVANDATLALSASTKEEDASVFYCMQSNSDEYPYIFVSAQGGFLTFKALSDAYISRVTDFKVGPMVDVANNVTSTVDVRLGTVYITTNKRPGSTDDTDGCFVFKNQGNANTYDGADVPFHNDNFTSAIVMTEVAAESKIVYDIVVDGDGNDDAQANAYVAYDNGTVVRKAFHNGYLVTDAALTNEQLKAGFVGNVVKSATITVEDNVITLADVVTFPTPVKQDLYNTSNGSLGVPPYRIPGITVDPETGRIITTAARLVCGTDPGYGQVDVVCRISDNHGDTWSEMKDVAVGTGITSPTENYFDTAFGDPAVVADRTSDEVLIVVVAGCTKYQTATRAIPNMIGTIHSTDNGATWGTPVNVTEDIYKLFDSGNPMESAFVGGGKIFQSRIVKVGQYYRLYAAMCARPNGNRVIYSDDFGRTWHALGGASALPAPGGDEPKCEEMPDGRVILSSRVGGGRIYNIYTYSNTETAEGSWGTSVTSTFEGSGKTHNGQSTNGEILIVPVVRNSDQKEMYLTLQSLPAGGGRSHVGIFYKELTDMTDINTVANFAIDWNGYFEVTDKTSAYSSMDLQKDDRIGFIYEENYTKHGEVYNPHSIPFPSEDPEVRGKHNYDGYDNIYVAYPLEIITNGAYSIKRDVDRREFLRSYFTDLTAEAIDEVKDAIAVNLEGLSTEPTIGQVDNIYFNIGKKDIIIAANANAGKVGYYLDEAVATYKEEVMAATTREQLAAAETKLVATEWVKPVSGKAYTFKNVQKDGTTVRWYKYDTTGKNIVLTATESEATPFVCRLLDNGKYVFVCNDGKYMTWRANASNHTTSGVMDAYDKTANKFYTDITINKMTKAANINGDLSTTCYVSISASRDDRNETGYVVVKKNNGNPTFDGASAAFYNDSYSSAFIMEEATYANTPKLNSVGEGELLSANLHNKYMGTFSAPFPTVVPEGVTAYYATKGNGYVTLNAIAPDNAIAANTGVILVGEAAGNAVMVPAAAETVATTEGNLLAHSAGAVKDMTGVANAYKFANGNQGMGFYKFSGGTLPMNEAYLQIVDEKEAIGIRFVVECAIGAYKIATFYANDAMNIPSGVKAYVATTAPVMDGENGIITMTEITDGIIPAKTGAVLRGEQGNYTFEPATEAGDTEVTGNLLHGYAGTAEFETVELPNDGSVNYVLTVMDGKAGFYRKNASFNVYNNKAYLNVPGAADARALYFEFDNGTTGIVEVENESEKTEIYDLAGRRVQKVQKGLYIVNGKKVLK